MVEPVSYIGSIERIARYERCSLEAAVTRVDRREFSTQLAQQGGRIHVDSIPQPLMRQLEGMGVDRDALSRISGGDDIIEGPEFNALYDALAVRTNRSGQRVDGEVSEDLFRSLAARVERSGAGSLPGSGELSGGSGRTRTTGLGGANLEEAANLRGRTDGERPGWFTRACEAVAEFFVELFTSRDYITSDERDRDVGRQLAMEHPETLRAILAQPEGESLLRQQLISQRPAGTSEQDWNGTVNDVMRGMQRTLDRGAPDLPDDVNPNASLAVRDRAATLFAQNPDPAARRELAATVDALSRSGLSERAQIAALSRWNDAGRPAAFRQHLEAITGALSSRSPAVRDAAVAQLEQHPERLDRLHTLVTSEGFRSAHLTDADRIGLLRTSAGTGANAAALANLLSSPTGRALAPAVREAMISGFQAHPNPAQAVRNLETLLGNRGFGRVSTAVQTEHVRLMLNPSTTAAQSTQALTRLESAQTGRLAPLNDVLFGDRTLAAGATGPDVRTTQRYLRALGYDGIVGMNESDTFGASTTAAVTEFQRRNGLTPSGIVDRATMGAIVDQMRSRGMDPTSYRFTTDLSLNRPTRTTDGPWRATQRWTPALQQEFSQFADAYTRARIPAHPDGSARRPEFAERVDCADLSYEALVQFARQRGLPIHLQAGGQTYSHSSRGPIVHNIQNNLGAMHLQQFTRPLAAGEMPRSGDLGNMEWDQSLNGHDSRYWHSHNIVEFDPLFREATVIFGSLDDLVRDSALTAFNTRGFNLTIHDVPEVSIIDAINDDSGQGRQVPRAEQEQRVRALLERFTTGGHRVSDADVSAFITMIGNERNLYRNAPTAVSGRTGAFHDLVEGQPWADPTARRAAVADLNRRFGATFTEGDIDRLVAAGDRASVTAEARRIVEQRVPAAQRAGAAEALMDATRPTIRYHANRDALSDSGLRASAVRSFNATFGARVRDSDLTEILRAGDSAGALAAATRIVAARGVPADRRAEAARALVEATDQTRQFRRWDFDSFNRHM